MASEQFLSYHTYYLAAFMYGLFMRRWLLPVVLLVVVWHYMIYGLIVGPDRFKDPEFHYWLPITAMLGVTMGYLLSGLVNLRRLLFWKQFDLFGCWLIIALIEFTAFHGVFAIWETNGWAVRPSSYIVTFCAFCLGIPLAYFFTRGSTVWAFWDEERGKLSYADKAALKFHSYWAVYQLSGTLTFTVIEWANPDIWPFWIALGVFVFHIVMWFLISLFIINDSTSAHQKYKKVRNELSAQLERVPGAGAAMLFPWSDAKKHRSATAIEMELADKGEEQPLNVVVEQPPISSGQDQAPPKSRGGASPPGGGHQQFGKLTDYKAK